MEFKEKIKFVRGELMISQEELAKRIGVSFSTVSRWELGKSVPQLVQQKKFEIFCNKYKIKFV